MASKAGKYKLVSAIGLDIGTHAIKCVEVAQGQGAIQLRRVSIFPATGDSAAHLSKVLKVVFDPYGGRPERLRISVSSGSSLIIRRIKLPLMSAGELKSAIVFEAEGHIPFPIDECLLDFQILSQNQEKKEMEVLLVAAKKAFIMERLKLLESVGVVPEIIDVDIFCLINAFEVLGHDAGHKTYGILNVGHSMSSFAILHDKLPFFVREISLGGRDITKALAEIRKVSEEEAELMKAEKDPQKLAVLQEATRAGLEPLVDELKHSLDFFENETGEEVKQIWMSGGGALAQDAPAILSEELGRQVTLWDNLKKMEIFGEVDRTYLDEHAHELNVALGMVLRGGGGGR